MPPESMPPSVDDFDAPTTAVEPPGGPGPAVPEEKQSGTELDRLFAQLSETDDPAQAKPVVLRIQRIWMRSGSPTVDLLMARSAAALKGGDLALALDLADMVSRLAPNFAEGWNRRATINYLREDYGRALVDIERTLALEPRHWGAMSGLGIILRRMGRDDEALATFKEVLKLNPTSENARKAVDALSEQFAGEDA
ncbi:tetratricopeptide repeat protein [Stappia sp.]|uniref:tetratricopeptide repeat protein n=1 Tax=Stappia sp. TaxID=1870903 RepID=UPI003A9A2CD8